MKNIAFSNEFYEIVEKLVTAENALGNEENFTVESFIEHLVYAYQSFDVSDDVETEA